jgi:AcrR family transcriptional regulator
MERDRDKKKDKILRALGRILRKNGFESVGVNAVAREAKVDKVLIYRYFGGLPGLLSAFAQEAEYWPSAEDLTGGPGRETESKEHADSARHMISSFCRYIREHSLTRELLRWELIESNELTRILADHRETEGLALMKLFENNRSVDVYALTAILAAGIIYLSLCAKHTGHFNGIDIRSDRGWRRIEKTAASIVDTAFKE